MSMSYIRALTVCLTGVVSCHCQLVFRGGCQIAGRCDESWGKGRPWGRISCPPPSRGNSKKTEIKVDFLKLREGRFITSLRRATPLSPPADRESIRTSQKDTG